MRGVALAVVWMLTVMVVTIIVFHCWMMTRRFRVMCLIFLAGLVGFVIHALLTQPEPPLWAGALRLQAVAELLNGLYFYWFLFFGIFVQAYGLADRGFSVGILTALYYSSESAKTRRDIKQLYAGGKGMAYVRQKRVQQMVHGGLIQAEGESYHATRLGALIGRIFLALKRLYQFQETG